MYRSTATSDDCRKGGAQYLLDEYQLAERLNVSVALLRKWRRQGKGPPYLKLGTLVRYRLEDAELWLDAFTRGAQNS